MTYHGIRIPSLCDKARIMRRMVNLDLNHDQLFDVYCKEVRSILEFGVPIWHPGLTKKDSNNVERIQRVAFWITVCRLCK